MMVNGWKNQARRTWEATEAAAIAAEEKIEDVAGAAEEKVVAAGAKTKTGVLDAIDRASRLVAAVRGLGIDDLLARFGLEKRRSPIGYLGAFGVGVLVGAGAAALTTPMAGRELRGRALGAVRRLASDRGQLAQGASAILGRAAAYTGQRLGISHKDDGIDELADTERTRRAANPYANGQGVGGRNPERSPSR
jgi:hypothetical protein